MIDVMVWRWVGNGMGWVEGGFGCGGDGNGFRGVLMLWLCSILDT